MEYYSAGIYQKKNNVFVQSRVTLHKMGTLTGLNSEYMKMEAIT
jgi:hypothetical protein